MATNFVKTPLLRAVATRSISQSPRPIGGQISDIKTSTLPNKLVVASCDNGSPLARLSIVLRAGSRFETPENQGAAHVLRIAAGLSTKGSTHFAIVRNIQQVGATLTCTTDRELIAYTLEGTYEAVERTSEFLCDVATEQVFKPWELSDSLPRLRLELESLTPEVRVMNFLHRAAYRNGLGNSLFCSKHNVGKLSSETLQHYVNTNFTTNRAAVIGLGVPHDQLVKYAQNLGLESGSETDAKSRYYGGEIRSEKGGDLAYVAIGAEGASCSNQKDALACAVLQRVLGAGPSIKRGVENSGLLSKAVGAGSSPVAVSAFNVSYSDSGFIGALIFGPANAICDPVVAVVRALRSAQITDDVVTRAKKQLLASTLLAAESGSEFVQTMGTQALLSGNVLTPGQISSAIEGVQTADVQRVAQKLASSPLSIASVGNLSNVPYLDQLQ